ncbi:type ISP restriction/modification enzyme [Capnocytophaga gingivalis]|uniref:type ISP restriction/modification enzyme n=1 Tax=Capnocytophaga gingivalis TaxID=1017 RepID=UPI0028D55D81|nr:type ISP restriction/modification enzyme [Capnocytophaga gingivalis]
MLHSYIKNLNTQYTSGKATEHSYRPLLKNLLESLLPKLNIINEPKRQACGAPDYILTLADLPIGFIETKDIKDKDLKGEKSKNGNKEQFDRYKKSLTNLIFTNYLTFHFYRNEELLHSIAIAKVTDKGITPLPENFDTFLTYIQNFGSFEPSGIAKTEDLVTLMAAKAQLLSKIIEKALSEDLSKGIQTDLTDQLTAFSNVLIHDISPKDFADMYAQTITYGLFTARYHDPTLPTFSRQEACQLLPASNPFLKKLFGYIAGMEVDTRISWVIDDLVQMYLACDVAQMLASYGKDATKDPIVHFYEDFLEAFDPQVRKDLGVWYTPLPVVNFMVRTLDTLLKEQFQLPQGIADTSKIKVQTQQDNKIAGFDIEEKEYHRVQILDPATGTGTFLAQIIEYIAQQFASQQGIWQNYVQEHLLPRLNGFELLMASYAIAHLKLDMLLSQRQITQSTNRIQIYLTNSLEEPTPDRSLPLARWLSDEANEANRIKRDTPVMCIIGNPPYNGSSTNKGSWIMNLMEDYKKEPNSKKKLAERNPKWINDDYVKFIRFGAHFIEKNGSGILIYINPHGFLDNPTFRGMRYHLLKTFDSIYTIDLHGNSRKKETTPSGETDENVFNIMQGVSINIFVKKNNPKNTELAKVYHYNLYGKRTEKLAFLDENNLHTIPFTQLNPIAPNYLFVPKNNTLLTEYNQGFSINELFKINSVGVVTARDNFTIHFTKEEVKQTIQQFLQLDDEKARDTFQLGKDVRDWQVSYARKDLQENYPDKGTLIPISYRPFDTRYTYYTGKSKGFHCYPRNEVMQHFIKGNNIGLVVCKQVKSGEVYQHFFITNQLAESCIVSNKTGEIGYVFPLYLYLQGEGHFKDTLDKIPNLNPEILKKLGGNPLTAFDYCYGVLHDKNYREQYKEFLKMDFPRIPYPKDNKELQHYATIGKHLRELYLLESPQLQALITSFPIAGNNTITEIKWVDTRQKDKGNIYINDTQYFADVPLKAWEAYIGGYQPAQKWLNDRKGQSLTYNDIIHYQQMIVALQKTQEIINS